MGEKMIVIPARLGSTRFNQKILAKLGDKPLFIQSAINAKAAGRVLIAVDDESVLKIAKSYGFEAVMTDSSHKSGSDRINEAIGKVELDDDEIVVNVQADEPFFESSNLVLFKEFATEAILKNGAFMASCYKVVDESLAKDPNLVKVVTDEFGNALYFSRSLIPYPRESVKSFKAHIGIYAYSKKTLMEFCHLKESFLENSEKLEQLRALESGKKIAMLAIKTSSFGIDTKEDYERAVEFYRQNYR